MNLFLCFDGDHIGRQVGRAVLTDDVSEVRRVDQAINHGNEIWKSFALRAGGSVIEIGGDEGRIELGVDHLGEVADITRQYAEAVGATVSVGVGMKLSDSAKALAVAKLRGGNQIVLWTPDMQQELDAVPQKTEAEKISDEYLAKGDEQHDTGKNRGTHAGFSGHHKPGSATTDKPKATQGDHDPAKVAQHTIKEGADAMPSPEMTHSADDLEQNLHDAAQAQEKDDTTSTVKDDMGLDQLKKRIVATLAGVKAQMPVLVQLKQTAPDAYQTIMNLVQGVLALGKEVMKEQPPVDDTDPQHVEQGLGKAEVDRSLCVDCGSREKPTSVVCWRDKDGHDDDIALCHPCKEARDRKDSAPDLSKADAPFVPEHPFDPSQAHDPAYLKQYLNRHLTERVSMVDPSSDSDNLDWKYHPAFSTAHLGDPEGYKGYLNDERRDTGESFGHLRSWLQNPHQQPVVAFQTKAGAFQPSDGSHRLGAAAEQGVKEIPAIVGYQRLDKAALKPQRHHLNLPVGSIQDNRIKVAHADGKTGWVQAESGLVQGQEPGAPNTGPNSHPVSSRKPSAR